MNDDRQRNYFQKYTADTKTLAVTHDWQPASNTCTLVTARIRITREDTRLPMTVMLAFDPDGGSPDEATITSRQNPRIVLSELVLCRRSYVPILKAVGSDLIAGHLDMPTRPGALGFAWKVSDECDAVDIRAQLPHALGAVQFKDSINHYFGGRWVVGYSFTTNERLSKEEWSLYVSRTNLMADVSDNSHDHPSTPVLVSTVWEPPQ